MEKEGTSRCMGCQKIKAHWGEHRCCVKIPSVILLVQGGKCGKHKREDMARYIGPDY